MHFREGSGVLPPSQAAPCGWAIARARLPKGAMRFPPNPQSDDRNADPNLVHIADPKWVRQLGMPFVL